MVELAVEDWNRVSFFINDFVHAYLDYCFSSEDFNGEIPDFEDKKAWMEVSKLFKMKPKTPNESRDQPLL